jgi:hypothetical protein
MECNLLKKGTKNLFMNMLLEKKFGCIFEKTSFLDSLLDNGVNKFQLPTIQMITSKKNDL